MSELELIRPLDYGQLAWGLPFGFSIDLTAELLTELRHRLRQMRSSGGSVPMAVYVVDVHGSITHRQAIIDGLQRSECDCRAFRWLHEPLAEFRFSAR